ncbi:drug/metabolite transporter (DMT)-like permease [Hymenobacter luteus]|uniref:Drug/metabolite transporter (DMT)-like permease n=2 Tax=Hymenobacter TaxID=89966 RepID=A0A7W9T0C3_9BACT|nr:MULTISPECIES: DMT family transporter [Hymenobacter]MBB4600541.1 drug/metabolite transporter (DMT)-like permease [Hymenobacter latericoloratus]MBB6059252.1 drug/metabolite transporter (DMT)-like permease [Hymenobacter luteus]
MLKDYLRLHFIVLLWGFTAILGKLISLPPVELVFWRTLLAATGLAGLLLVRRQPWQIPAGEALRLLGIGALVATHWITFFLSARLSSVSVSLAGMATLALWTSLLEPLLLWRRVRPYEVGLGLLTMVGLYLVSQAELDQLPGLLVAVVSAGLSALFSVFNSKLVQRHPPLRLTLYEMAGACLSIALFLPIYGRYFTEGRGVQLALSGFDWLWLLVLAGVCTVYAFSTSVELMKRISAFVVNLTINLEPVYGIILAVLMYTFHIPGFGQEKLSTKFYMGTVLILLSVLIHPVIDQWNRRRIRKKEAADVLVG